jgi:hypothetical protein
LVGKDAEEVLTLLLTASSHSNPEVRAAGARALESFLVEVTTSLVERKGKSERDFFMVGSISLPNACCDCLLMTCPLTGITQVFQQQIGEQYICIRCVTSHSCVWSSCQGISLSTVLNTNFDL